MFDDLRAPIEFIRKNNNADTEIGTITTTQITSNRSSWQRHNIITKEIFEKSVFWK